MYTIIRNEGTDIYINTFWKRPIKKYDLFCIFQYKFLFQVIVYIS